MTHVGPSPATSAGVASQGSGSFVEWGPVIAGAVLASSLSFVLLTFGAAIGLSVASPWRQAGPSLTLLGSLAILWAMAQQIGAFMAGGYVAGRMRARWQGTAEHEVEFRDGLHGGLVWAVGVVIGAALLMAAGGAAARTGAEVTSRAVSMSKAADPMEVLLDTMVRPASVGQAQGQGAQQAQGTQKAAPPAGQQTARAQEPAAGSDEQSRAEMSRIIASSVASGSISAQDRSYLAQMIAQRTGLPQAEAEKRVNEAFNSAKEAVDNARRAAVITGFVTAAGLIISFGAAWWAALKGGQHRDNSVPPRFPVGNRLRRPGT